MEERWSEGYPSAPGLGADYGALNKAASHLQQLLQVLKDEDAPTPRLDDPTPRLHDGAFGFSHSHWDVSQQVLREGSEDGSTARSAISHVPFDQEEQSSAPFGDISFAAGSDGAATCWQGGDFMWSGFDSSSGAHTLLPQLPLSAGPATEEDYSHRSGAAGGFLLDEHETASRKSLLTPLSAASSLKMTESPLGTPPVMRCAVPDTSVNGDLGKVCYLTLLELLLGAKQSSKGEDGVRRLERDQDSEPFAEPLAWGDLQKSQVQLLGTAEELEQLRQLLQHCSTSVNEAEIEELRAVVERQQEEISQFRKEGMQLQSNLANNMEENIRLRSFIAESSEQQAELGELRAVIHRQQEELSELRIECMQAQSNLSSTLEECNRQRSLLMQSSQQQAECAQLQSDLASSEMERSRQASELRRVRAEVATLHRKLDERGQKHAEELQQLQVLLKQRDSMAADFDAERHARLRAEKDLQEAKDALDRKAEQEVQACQDLQEAKDALDRKAEQEVQEAKDALDRKAEQDRLTREKDALIEQMEEKIDHEFLDYAKFLKRMVSTSVGPCLSNTLDMRNSELLGMGNYGYVLTCEDRVSKQRVVVKLQSQRWLAVAVKEWAHGDDMRHEHIVDYRDVICHRDSEQEIRNILEQGFAQGTLKGRRPAKFPESYLCLVLEYMDRGTVENLMASGTLDPKSTAAITQQVATAIAFMHRQKRTHNDIKPANILLTQAPCGGGHLVAKLADLGLAEYSDDHKRDKSLFAYTIWVMALNRQFEKCPSRERQDECLRIMADAEPAGRTRDVWRALQFSTSGLWSGTIAAHDVASMPQLKGHTVQISASISTKLEVAAREDAIRRHSRMSEGLRAETHRKTCALDRLQLAKMGSTTWTDFMDSDQGSADSGMNDASSRKADWCVTVS